MNYLDRGNHESGCLINTRCLVYHIDGVCPGPYGTCTCKFGKKDTNEVHS